MSYTITGKVKQVGDVQAFTNFKKKEIVITTEGDYPKDIAIEFAQKQMAKLDNVSRGDKVEIVFDVDGREHNGRHFVNLRGFGLKKDIGSKEYSDPYDPSKVKPKVENAGRPIQRYADRVTPDGHPDEIPDESGFDTDDPSECPF